MAGLRILHALVAPGRGGAEAMALALARAQQDAGHDVSLLLLSRGPLVDYAAAAGVHARLEPVASSIDLRGMGRAARVIASSHPDVVHCHSGRPLVAISWAKARGPGGARVVYTRHGDAGWLGRPRLAEAAHTAFERGMFRAVDAIACVNEALCAADEERFPSIPVELILNGVDVRAFAPAGSAVREAVRAAFGVPRLAPLVACTSRLVPLKGVDVLVQAWRHVVGEHRAAHLVIAGDGECRATLEAMTSRAGLAASVHFAGSLGDVARLVGAADVFVFPSVRGCFGRSALEALAAATPVVASRLDGTERFVRDGETARLVPPGEPGALAAAIADLLGNDRERDALGRRGRVLAEARYSVDGMAAAYEALYARAGSR